jgi:hypothetical protein
MHFQATYITKNLGTASNILRQQSQQSDMLDAGRMRVCLLVHARAKWREEKMALLGPISSND